MERIRFTKVMWSDIRAYRLDWSQFLSSWKTTVLFWVGLVNIGCLQPDFVSAITLEKALEVAFVNDAATKAEIFAAEAKYAEGAQSLGDYGPTLNISASYMDSTDRLYSDSGDLEDTSADFVESEYKVSFEQPLVDLEKASLAARGYKAMNIAELLGRKAREDLILLVNERFYGALAAREAFRITHLESDALRQQVEHAKERIALGFGTITDQYDAEARYRVSLATEIAKRTELENALKALQETLGIPIKSVEDTQKKDTLPTLPGELQGWKERAEENNTDLLIRKFQYESANLDYRARQSRFLPSLSLFADYVERDADDGLVGYGEKKTEADVGIRLQMNILNGGTDTAATVAASKRRFEARERVTAAKRSLQRSVSSLWDSIKDTASLLDAYDLAVIANKHALEATKASYTEGVKTLLDVLNAQQEYYAALGQYNVKRYDYLIMIERFHQVVGDSIDVRTVNGTTI